MAWFLPALATALASKVIGGGQQQPQQQLDFTFQHRPRVTNSMPFLRGVDPQQAQSLAQDPILAAMMNSQPEPEPDKKPATTWGKTKDEFLSSLTQNLVQRLIFGGGQQGYQYNPPNFR